MLKNLLGMMKMFNGVSVLSFTSVADVAVTILGHLKASFNILRIIERPHYFGRLWPLPPVWPMRILFNRGVLL